METPIEKLWEDIEDFGWKAVQSKRDHYLKKEKDTIKESFESGRITGRLGFDRADGEYYYEMTFKSEENEKESNN